MTTPARGAAAPVPTAVPVAPARQCATRGCDRPAAWISVYEARVAPNFNNRYRCPPCCDAIAAYAVLAGQ